MEGSLRDAFDRYRKGEKPSTTKLESEGGFIVPPEIMASVMDADFCAKYKSPIVEPLNDRRIVGYWSHADGEVFYDEPTIFLVNEIAKFADRYFPDTHRTA